MRRTGKVLVPVLGVFLIGLTFLFQNCSESLPQAATEFQSGGSGQTSWAKGDAFDFNKLPVKSQMLHSFVVDLDYAGFIGNKAIAVAASGLGFAARLPTTATQGEANQSALEGCFAISGGQPCALLAIGNTFNLGKDELADNFLFSMTAPSTVTNSTIPFATTAERADAAAAYNVRGQPKAMAVSLDGTIVWVPPSQAAPLANVADARKVAL